MTIHKLRTPFWVVADEVQRCAGATGCGIHAVRAVLEKLAQKRLGMVADARSFQTSNAGLGQDIANGGCGEVIQAVVLGRCAMPVADVGLVPNLPKPG